MLKNKHPYIYINLVQSIRLIEIYKYKYGDTFLKNFYYFQNVPL